MKFNVIITNTKLVSEFPEHWAPEDYRNLLESFEFEDASEVEDGELREMLFLAMSDLDPDESARKVLSYKLGDKLSEGQIDQISHEMLQDKISEEYADISLHHALFHVNQLLYKGYNGTFPNARASVIEFEMTPVKDEGIALDKATVLRAFAKNISDRSIIKRLFEDQLKGGGAFAEAEDIVWGLEDLGDGQYRIITSEYWLDKEDLLAGEFEATVEPAD